MTVCLLCGCRTFLPLWQRFCYGSPPLPPGFHAGRSRVLFHMCLFHLFLYSSSSSSSMHTCTYMHRTLSMPTILSGWMNHLCFIMRVSYWRWWLACTTVASFTLISSPTTSWSRMSGKDYINTGCAPMHRPVYVFIFVDRMRILQQPRGMGYAC